ncbi:DUF5011 domain-containing protein [Paenibacillus andongensis]|uniref:DUF5011 domain-containing protein n=1 Tax=Paenibacillus andongensis TaxID=2975482 RepID=UPI0021BAA91F|nr:DUF5011 domain-containing protein [Paenibacillus andongensis]
MKRISSMILAVILLIGGVVPYASEVSAAVLLPASVKQPTGISVIAGGLDPFTGKYFLKPGDMITLVVDFESSSPSVLCHQDSMITAEVAGSKTTPAIFRIPVSPPKYMDYPSLFQYTVGASDASGRLVMKQGPELCYYKKLDNAWHSYSNYRTNFSDGTSMDNVTYFKSLFKTEVYIDNTAPTITFGQTSNSDYKNSHGVTVTTTDLPVEGSVSLFYTWTQSAAPPAAAEINTSIVSGTVAADPTGNGAYYLHARAVDKVGHETINTAGPFNYDHVAPTITFGPYAADIIKKSHGVTVTANDTPVNENVNLYYTWTQSFWPPQDEEIATGILSGAAALDPPGSGVYYLHAKAVDAAGNTTIRSSGAIMFDNEPPKITLGPISSTAQRSQNVTYTVIDSFSGLKQWSYEWFKDGVSYSTGTASSSVGMLSVPNSLEGNYRLKITATDFATNVRTMGSLDYVIDKTAPAVSFSEQGNSTPANARQVNVSLLEARGTLGQASYLWSSSVTVPSPSSQEWKLFYDGAGSKTSHSATLSSPVNANNTQYLHIKTTDSAGNIGYASTTQGFVLDNTKPTVAFSNPSTSTYSKSVTTSLSLSDNITTTLGNYVIKYVVTDQATTDGNDVTWSRSTNGAFTVANKSGTYYIHVKVYDQAGNWQLARGGPYLLDDSAPTGTIHIPVEQTNNKSVEVELTAADLHGPIDMRLSANGGTTWGSWEAFATTKLVTIPETEGVRTISVQYRDAAGNISTTYSDTVIYDVTKPTAVKISYNTTQTTNQSVTATLTAVDNITASGDIDVVNLSGFSYVFQANGTYTFVFRDKAGNENTAVATVTWIDKTKPQIQFSAEGVSDKRKAASSVISATDNVTASNQLTYAYAWSMNASTAPTTWTALGADHTAELSGANGLWYLWAKVTDKAGNEAIRRTNSLFQLDNTNPVGVVTYSPAGRTASDVKATLATNESVRVMKPSNGSKENLFTDNGSFEFEFVDDAGNVGKAMATVNGIDRSLPYAAVTLSPSGWTNGPVRVTVDASGNPALSISHIVVPEDAVPVSQTVQQAVYDFKTNGILQYTLLDGGTPLTSEGEVVIHNIDLVPPTADLMYSTLSKTNEDVTVTLITYDDNHGVVTIAGSDTYTFTENGSHTFIFQDEAGNVSQKTATVNFIDKQAPVPVLTYSESTWTKQNVTVSLTFMGEDDPVTITNNEGSAQYTFKENGTFVFYYRDAAGNEGQVTAEVTVIDRDAPTAIVSYSEAGWTNHDVVATLVAQDNSGVLPTVVNNGGLTTYTFTQNGTFKFVYQDAAGNQREINANVDRIDKTPPVASVQYSTAMTTKTNADVRASVEANEPITVMGNNGSTTRDFTANGNYAFRVADRAGNESTITANVYNIDRTRPVLNVTYSKTAPTKDDVIVTVEANEPIQVLNNNRSNQVVFKENGSFTFLVQDLAGNTAEAVATVSNITKATAKVTYAYSETVPTKNTVSVTLTADRPLTYAGISGNVVTFTENGTRWVEATDALNNKYVLRIDVNNIDREAPKIRFLSGEQLLIDVGTTSIDPASDVDVSDNLDGNLKEKLSVFHNIHAGVPGEYEITYKATDRAGNQMVVVRKAIVIAPTTFTLYVNSKQLQDTEAVVYGDAIQLKLFGQQGSSQMKWARGYKNKGDFKTFGQEVANGNLPVKEYGLYTFFIQDQERQTKLVHVYILPTKSSE